MNKQLRWFQITDLCKQKEIVSVTEIADALLISPATVRRDLQEMEDLGMIIRTHGGAKITGDQTEEPSMILKAESNSSEKKQIAYAAAKLIKDNQMVYLDAGSTTYAMIEYIIAKNITVVTPGIPHVELLGKKGISTIMLGGIVRWSTQAITGKQATKQLNDYYFDVCFIGTNGIHEQIGFTTSNEMEADTKALAIHHSKQAYILADESKFNRLCLIQFAKLDEAIVICNNTRNFDEQKINCIKLQ